MRSRPMRPAIARPRVPDEDDSTPDVQPVPFAELPLSIRMLNSVADAGYHTATPIQAGAIPFALDGCDVIGQAQTGSGKTAAFAIPMLERLQARDGAVQALVLCPTRELAVQVHEEVSRLASRHELQCVAIYGGDSMARQLNDLRKGAHIIVATPGRLADHWQRHSLRLDNIRMVVLDEADRMLDMGFAPDVEKILRGCRTPRQTLLFSATMPEWVRRIAARHMHDPVTVAINARPEIPSTVRQIYLQTSWAEKTEALLRILEQPDVVMALIFVETKRTADLLQVQLERRGVTVGLLHGDLTQRDRNRAMETFHAAHVRFLIATNIAARGLDIDDISHVINYDVPLTPDEYVHRVGRTGRAGRSGVAITLITPAEILKIRDIERHAQTSIAPAILADFPVPRGAASA